MQRLGDKRMLDLPEEQKGRVAGGRHPARVEGLQGDRRGLREKVPDPWGRSGLGRPLRRSTQGVAQSNRQVKVQGPASEGPEFQILVLPLSEGSWVNYSSSLSLSFSSCKTRTITGSPAERHCVEL